MKTKIHINTSLGIPILILVSPMTSFVLIANAMDAQKKIINTSLFHLGIGVLICAFLFGIAFLYIDHKLHKPQNIIRRDIISANDYKIKDVSPRQDSKKLKITLEDIDHSTFTMDAEFDKKAFSANTVKVVKEERMYEWSIFCESDIEYAFYWKE